MEDTEFERKKERHGTGQSTVSTDSVSNYIPTPPDGGYGWVIVMAAFFIHVIVDGITFTFGVFYVAFLDYFKEGNGKTAMIGSMLTGFYLMIGPLASALVNKFGCRPVALSGSLISSAAFALCTVAPTTNMLMFTYGFLAGCGFGLLYLPSIVAVSFYFQKKRAVATGIAVCGAGVGGFLFAPFGRWMLDYYDWKNAMLIVSAISLQGAVFAMLLRPLEAPKRKKRPRAKNVLDRLMEQTKRNRKESECSQCAHSTKPGNHADHNSSLMERIQEVKLAREMALREEDGEESELGMSVPNSAINSVRRLDDVSCNVSLSPTRNNSFNRGIPIPGRQDSLRYDSISEYGNSPPTHACSAPVGRYGGSPTTWGATPPVGDNTSTNTGLPMIVVEEDDEDIRRNEKIHMIQKNGTIPVPDPTDGSKQNDKGMNRKNGIKFNEAVAAEMNGKVHTMNGSVPNSIYMQADKKAAFNLLPESLTDQFNMHSQSANVIYDKTRAAELERKKNKWTRPRGVQKADYARPMYRKDIFYSGSVLNVPQFRSQVDVHVYAKSMTSIPGDVEPEDEFCLCRRLPKEAKDILKEMMGISLLRDPIFIVACLGNMFAFIGIFVPFVYMTNRAISMGIDEDKAALLLSVVGITNTVGRVVAGLLADIPCINPLLLHNLSVIGAGIACIANMASITYAQMVVFSAIFGYCLATYISLTSIILANLLGMERLTNAFGLLCMIRGIASLIGPPVAGLVYDATNDYDQSFHVGGSFLIVAGLMFCLLHLPYFQRRSAANQHDIFEQIEVVFDDELILRPPLPPTDAEMESGIITEPEDGGEEGDDKLSMVAKEGDVAVAV